MNKRPYKILTQDDLEVLPNIDEEIQIMLAKGKMLTAPYLAPIIGMSTAGIEKKLKRLESNGLVKSSIQRVKYKGNVKLMRVYERVT